jgi:hypothetical protein
VFDEEIRRCADLWKTRLGDRALAVARHMEKAVVARGDAKQAEEWRRIIAVLGGDAAGTTSPYRGPAHRRGRDIDPRARSAPR